MHELHYTTTARRNSLVRLSIVAARVVRGNTIKTVEAPKLQTEILFEYPRICFTCVVYLRNAYYETKYNYYEELL